MTRVLACLLACVAVLGAQASSSDGPGAHSDGLLEWERLPDLPDALGVAGPFVGASKGALIVAGGANFPSPLWETSKRWHDAIWVLREVDGAWQWAKDEATLPRRTAYGACVTAPEGVVCVGGLDGKAVIRECVVLSWDPDRGRVRMSSLPAMPQGVAHAAAARVGRRVWLFCGMLSGELASATNHVWTLHLDHPDLGWRRGPSLPGPTRALALAVAQHGGRGERVYVMSGRRQGAAGVELLSDCWEFNPRVVDLGLVDAETGAYDGPSPWRRRADAPRCVMAGTAAPLGDSHVVVLGGDAGENFGRAAELKDDHPGFIRRSLVYHTITDTWAEAGATPINQVTTWAVPFAGGVVVPSGEIRPRVRTRQVWVVRSRKQGESFGAVNLTVVGAYLLAMLGIGFWFARKRDGTDGFFRGGQRVPAWAVSLSIFATMLSSITFVATPAKVFATDWTYFFGNLMILAVVPVVIRWYLPFFRRIDATSAYEYLEKRFSGLVRLVGSAQFIAFQVARMAIVLLLPALALEVITPLGRSECILLMGGLSLVYCTLGGIRAVIWTDVVQTIVLLGGAAFTLVLVLSQVGVGEAWESASAEGKLDLVNDGWSAFDPLPVLWVVVIGQFLSNLVQYGSDQTVVQRYMSTETEAKAARAILSNGVLSLLASVLFFGVGTALWAFYRAHPERLDPAFGNDQIFPLFIARELPVGIAGLVVAGVLAAAQSTISTSMNSVSTVLVTDWYRRFVPDRGDRHYLATGRVLTVVLGIIGTGTALVFAGSLNLSLLDDYLAYVGLLTSILGGLFLLGILSRRAHAGSALAGAAVGAVALFVVKGSGAHFFLFAGIGMLTTLVVGVLASYVIPGAPRTKGLTVWT